MKIQIFDVSHGFCAYLIADNGNVMLFDCGHNENTNFRPSIYLSRSGCTAIEHLIIHNFDQDHVEDLGNIVKMLPIKVLFRNRSIPPEVLISMKTESGVLTSAMQTAIDLHSRYIYDVPSIPFPNIEFKCFYNNYSTFTDTNNLSLVAFVHYDGRGIVFPGDLEKAGWQELLKNDLFKEYLKKVNFFVASHHGRESGYCEEVFEHCKPDIIIISDKEIVHETQKNCYAKHASGILWNGGPERRCVLTTRSDGVITITKTLGQSAHIQTENWKL